MNPINYSSPGLQRTLGTWQIFVGTSTLAGLYFAFEGSHLVYGGRAAVIFAGAFGTTVLSRARIKVRAEQPAGASAP